MKRSILITGTVAALTAVGATVVLALSTAGAWATGGGRIASACSNKTVTVFQPKPVAVTLRFVLHGKVSCYKAHRLMQAYFRRATPKYCVNRGTACSIRFPGGWDCARHVAGEHDGVAGCVREAPLATVTVYGVTSHTGSPLHLSDSARRTARSGASSSTAPASGKPPATTADRRLPT